MKDMFNVHHKRPLMLNSVVGVEQPFLAIDVGHEGHVQRSPQETANVELGGGR